MLYAWLAESDDRKFDQAFQRYYAEASPNLVRYLCRRSSLADLDCEQIAVDALLKFFTRVGRERRQAAETVARTLPEIEPLNLGPFHVRHVQRWTGEVGDFRQTSMSFKLTAADPGPQAWKADIQAQIDGIAPLQRQGLSLLDTVRRALAGDAVEPDSVHEVVRAFAAGLQEAAASGSPPDAESQYPGVIRFVDGTWSVVDVLPALRIPTNGYLFDIAQSLYLDECKARGRKKRGGSGVLGEEPASPHGLAPFMLDEEASVPEADEYGGGGFSAAAALPEAPGADPAAEQIDEDFCERFYEYLRKPLSDAEEAYRIAAAAGKGKAERKRLESLGEKHARLMSVLSMRIEGHTQEAIAEALHLSRNQVKYMTEQVQAAYQHFCTVSSRG
jgi:DNA-directed RNA polymerase specialized sigma24 family protein